MNWMIKQTIDLENPPKQSRETPYLLMLPGDNQAHVWEITVLKGKEPADLTGYTSAGYFLRRDDALVSCSGDYADISGNIVTITFKSECYSVPGGMRGAVRISKTGQTITLADQAFIVQPDMMGTEVVEDEFIPSLPDLLLQVSRLEQANDEAMVLLALNGITTAHVDGQTLYIDKIAVTDNNAYQAAQNAGYTGTEQEWDAFVAMVTNNTSMITAANTNAANAIAQVQSKSTITGTTLTVDADGWVGEGPPYTITVPCTIATANNILIVGIGGPLTTAQKKALSAADIICTGQANGSITLTAYFEKPAVDVPINVLGVS
jgi:hypothetical protein